jgi:hypothetical protein
MDTVVTPLKEFAKNSVRLVKRCTKPDRKGVLAAAALEFCYSLEQRNAVLPPSFTLQ